MLEIRKYKKTELDEIFGQSSKQTLDRKLLRYGVVFACEGRGATLTYDIQKITDPFKVFCIVELGYSGATDFHKLLYFMYYFINDDEFRAMPDEVKEARMRAVKKPISRQTIANYTEKLNRMGIINRNTGDFYYYFAYKQTQRFTTYEEYREAWKEYWKEIDRGRHPGVAIALMREKYGGVARKQAKPVFNAFFLDQIEQLNTLICQSIEKESE